MGAALPAVPLGTGRTAVALALGGDHTCALLDDNSLKCWGNANQGLIGSGNLFSKGDNPGEMGDALPTVALGTGRHAVEIDAGAVFTCARLDDATVKCWGNDPYGQRGHGRSPSNWGNQDWHMGAYSMPGVPAVPVRVRMMDLTGAHVAEYHDDISGPGSGSDYPSATVVAIAGGATTTIDASLAPTAPS